MPVWRDIPVKLELKEVLRAQGIKDYSRLRPVMKDAIHELLEEVNHGDLLSPMVACDTHPVAEVTDAQLSIEGNDAVLHGSLFRDLIDEAVEVTAVVCTIGPALEKQVADCFREDESLRGLLLDGIGSAAVGALGHETCQRIVRETAERGHHAGSPISPGSPRFPISEQWELFKMAPADEIGVSLSEAGLMLPRKSISMIIGIGHEMKTWTRADSCDRCNLGHTCPYRART